jgi:hypothetical protein
MSRTLRSLERITDKETADKIRGMIDGDTDPRDVSERADAHARACYHDPGRDVLILYAADELLGTYGVEGWPTNGGRDGVSYCNTGDTYAATLFLVRGRFMVSDLGTRAGH